MFHSKTSHVNFLRILNVILLQIAILEKKKQNLEAVILLLSFMELVRHGSFPSIPMFILLDFSILFYVCEV